VEKPVGFGTVDDFAAQRVILNRLTDQKGGDAQQNNFCQWSADVEACHGELVRPSLPDPPILILRD